VLHDAVAEGFIERHSRSIVGANVELHPFEPSLPRTAVDRDHQRAADASAALRRRDGQLIDQEVCVSSDVGVPFMTDDMRHQVTNGFTRLHRQQDVGVRVDEHLFEACLELFTSGDAVAMRLSPDV
jgi:hypothetical protein